MTHVAAVNTGKRQLPSYFLPSSNTRARITLVPRAPEAPKGLRWDSVDFSCAYDSSLTILYNTWVEAPAISWSDYINIHLGYWIEVFEQTKSFEAVRNAIRSLMNRLNASDFPTGPTMTGAHDVLELARPLMVKCFLH